MQHSRIGKNSFPACEVLPALNRDVDVAWFNLDQASPAASLVGSDQGRPGAPEGIEDDIVAVGAITDCVGDQRDRLPVRFQFAIDAEMKAAKCPGAGNSDTQDGAIGYWPAPFPSTTRRQRP